MDFGLSRISNSGGLSSLSSSDRGAGGTLRWQAPELLEYREKGRESEREQQRNTLYTDIYAFACVCYEV